LCNQQYALCFLVMVKTAVIFTETSQFIAVYQNITYYSIYTSVCLYVHKLLIAWNACLLAYLHLINSEKCIIFHVLLHVNSQLCWNVVTPWSQIMACLLRDTTQYHSTLTPCVSTCNSVLMLSPVNLVPLNLCNLFPVCMKCIEGLSHSWMYTHIEVAITSVCKASSAGTNWPGQFKALL